MGEEATEQGWTMTQQHTSEKRKETQMTQPDWRSIETVTEEMYQEGRWVWVTESGSSTCASPAKTGFRYFSDGAKLCARYRQVYGPIPEPPKPPPAIYRFEATFGRKRVSGHYMPDREGDYKFRCYWKSVDGTLLWDSATRNRLTNIHWKDTPPEGVE